MQKLFELTGGHLALDFANTVDNRFDPQRRKDQLTDYGELIAFLRQSVAIPDRTAAELTAAAHGSKRGQQVLSRAVVLREAIYRVFSAIANERTPAPDDVAVLNGFVREALSQLYIGRRSRGFMWEWPADGTDLNRAWWPVARAAADLLISEDAARVRECSAEDCGWLFLDTSRNRTRRWCDMKICGNRAKVRRFYRRHRRE
jgi:predicted RNA-binding Zn ribbon-like protein